MNIKVSSLHDVPRWNETSEEFTHVEVYVDERNVKRIYSFRIVSLCIIFLNIVLNVNTISCVSTRLLLYKKLVGQMTDGAILRVKFLRRLESVNSRCPGNDDDASFIEIGNVIQIQKVESQEARLYATCATAHCRTVDCFSIRTILIG